MNIKKEDMQQGRQDDVCIYFDPWDHYDSVCITIAECTHWSGEYCQHCQVQGECPKPWSEKK
jgi:hypothetical protein